MENERRKSQRRSTDRRQGDRRTDTLGSQLDAIPSNEVLEVLSISDARIEIRCPSPVKVEMEQIAGRFGITLTEYILRLHKLAKEKLADS